MPAETLAQDFIAGVKQNFLDDPPAGPEAFAETYVDPSSAFIDADSVIAGAKAILINEISKEPYLRKEIRRTFRTFGVVSVRPTEKGLQVIDELHAYYVRQDSCQNVHPLLTLSRHSLGFQIPTRQADRKNDQVIPISPNFSG